MIIIHNKQSAISLDKAHIKDTLHKILSYLNYDDYDISVVFVTRPCMERYNYDYRSIRKLTDILSFAHHAELKAGTKIIPQSSDDQALGDIILCPLYIQKDLERWNMSFEQRLDTLLIHGVCHLLGYDHESDSDYKIMKKLEDKLLEVILL